MPILYLDPGSTSFVVQAIAATALGCLFFFKNMWLRVKTFFGPKQKKEDDNNPTST